MSGASASRSRSPCAPTDSPGRGAERLDERVGRAARGRRELLDRERPPHEDLRGSAGPIDAERDDRPPRPHRPDSFDELEQPEPGELVARVVGETEQADEILDVRGLEEPQPAVLHVRDVPARQLELEQVAVVRGAHQHRLLAQRDALFAVREDLLAHRVDLRVLVGAAHEPRALAGRRLRAQPGHEALRARRR